MICVPGQGSKIALVRSYLRVPQAAGQVEYLIFLVKINFFPIYANNFCDAGQVPILRSFEAWPGIYCRNYFSAAADKGPGEMTCFPEGLHYLLTFTTKCPKNNTEIGVSLCELF